MSSTLSYSSVLSPICLISELLFKKKKMFFSYLHFELIMDSQDVGKMVPRSHIPFTHFLSRILSVSIGQYQEQEFYFGIVYVCWVP